MQGTARTHKAAWERAANSSLSDLLEIKEPATTTICKWRRGTLPEAESSRLDAAAWLIAELAMRLRTGSSGKLELWRSCAVGDASPSDEERTALEAFVAPSFGLPSSPGPSEHLQGAVAELVWYQLTTEASSPDRKTVRVEPPGLYVTAPGADGLAVYSNSACLSFRLWEIKKATGSSPVSTTVNRAYSQLAAHATRYLAQYTPTGDQFDDPQLKALYAGLVDSWVAGSPESGAGISVSTSHRSTPKKCFSTMQNYFDALVQDGQLEGLVTGLGDFPNFATRVRDTIWTAL